MAKSLHEKMIKELTSELLGMRDVIFLDQGRLTGENAVKVRRTLRETGTKLVSGRRNLVSVVAANLWHNTGDLPVVGALAVAFSGDDIVSLAKCVKAGIKGHDAIKIVGGFAEGSYVGAEQIEVFSESKGREELLQDLAGLLNAGGAEVVSVLDAVPSGVAGAVKSICG